MNTSLPLRKTLPLDAGSRQAAARWLRAWRKQSPLRPTLAGARRFIFDRIPQL